MASVSLSFEQRSAAAIELARCGRLAEALAALRALAREAPGHAPTRRMLASLLIRGGRPAEALAELGQRPDDDAASAVVRAQALLALGRSEEAADAARGASELQPDNVAAHFVLGQAELALRHVAAAARAFEAVLMRHPQAPLARRGLIRCRLLGGRADLALTDAMHPAVLDDAAEFAAVLDEFAGAGALAERTSLLAARAERHPDDYANALALAASLHQIGRISAALEWAERAHALRPDEVQPLEIRATALIDRGDAEAGLAQYRELPSHRSEAETAARRLVLMHYDPAQTNASLFEALQDFAARHLPRFGPPFVAARRSAWNALRIGWISPRFNEGPVASFLTGLLAAFDRMQHRHLLIALQPAEDAATRRLRALADEWFDLSGLDDASLLQRLRALELDVAIDLAGHSTANRLRVISQRVAPVQISWLDWFDTTAVPEMDAWISDEWLTPEGSTQRYTERLIRLPSGRFCYTPPVDAPPATHAGGDAIVFASFNRLAKLNDAVVSTWAAILRRVPGAVLQLGTRLLGDAATRAHLAERFGRRGIGADRLVLHAKRPYADLLAAYREVDIALDPFPFSGCTTTCDALYMGSAVITLPGETFVSRQSASLLLRLGCEEWIARDREDYVERAVAAAARVGELRAGREALREAVRARLCDAASQARDFAAALRELCGAAGSHGSGK